MPRSKRKTKKTTTRTVRKRKAVSSGKIISELLELKIPKSVLEPIARIYREPIEMRGSLRTILEKASGDFLKLLHRIFVRKENDKRGRFLEYRTALWIAKKHRGEITKIDVDYKVPGVGELDVVGLDEDDRVVVFAECKTRPVRYEDIDKWLSNIKRVFNQYPGVIAYSYFVSSSGYSRGVIDRVKKSPEISNGKLMMPLTDAIKSILSGGFRRSVDIEIIDERKGKFITVFP